MAAAKKALFLARVYYPTRGGVEVVISQQVAFMQSLGFSAEVLSLNPAQAEVFREFLGPHGEKVSSYKPLWHITSFLFSFHFFAHALKALIRLEPKSYVIVQHPSPLDAVLSLLGKILNPRVRLVVMVHSNIVNKNPILTFLSNWSARFSMVLAKHVLFTSETLREKLMPLLLPPWKYKHSSAARIAYEGTVDESFSDRKFVDPLRLVFVGRFVPYKGLSYLLEAMSGIKGVHLKILGGGPLEPELRKQQADLGLLSSVEFVLNPTEDLKNRTLKQSDVFVLASPSEAEAFGIVQLEAMAHGLAVINTDIPSGVPWVSQHKKTGLTVPARNAGALREAIETLRDQPELLRTFRSAALKRVKEFSWEKAYEEFAVAIRGEA